VDTDNRVMQTGTPIIDGVSASPDLSAKFMRYSKTPLYGKDGAVVGVAAVYRYIKDMHELPEWYGGLSAVAAYINARYAEPITIKQLAGIARCSSSMFVRGFKQLFKMTPINYLLLTRVNAARDLLEHSNRLVSDIAQTVGFYDQSHFIRVFKHFRTFTPHQYRLRYQGRKNE
jgi:AraC-like DNA-binding protein